jgi:plasmid maintenance system antidote protein VapI
MASNISGLDLKVERVRARVTATAVAEAMGVTRQRVSAIEALAVVTEDVAERFRTAMMSLTSRPETTAVA